MKWVAHRVKMQTCVLCGKHFRSLTKPSKAVTVVVENPAGNLYELHVAERIAPEIINCF